MLDKFSGRYVSGATRDICSQNYIKNLPLGSQAVMWPSQAARVSPIDHILEEQAKVRFDGERSKTNIEPKAYQGGRESSNGHDVSCRVYG